MEKELEIRFARALEEIKTIAGEQGNCIPEEHLSEILSPFSLEKGKRELVEEYLKKNHIGIGKPVNPEEYLSEKEKNYLEVYLEELKGMPPASQGEKEGITLSAMAGDQDAQRRLVEIYLPYVVDLARLYAGWEAPIEDLIGEGNAALTAGVFMLGCLEGPEEAEGMLGKMIMESMEELLTFGQKAKEGEEELLDLVNEVAKHAKELSELYRRDVTIREIVEESGLPEEQVLNAVYMSGNGIDGISSR